MHQHRYIRIRSQRREPADIRKLAKALVQLAQAQAEADAEREHDTRSKKQRAKRRGSPPSEAA